MNEPDQIKELQPQEVNQRLLLTVYYLLVGKPREALENARAFQDLVGMGEMPELSDRDGDDIKAIQIATSNI